MKPKEAHSRVYNVQENLQELSIVTNEKPHDLVINKRGGGLEKISDLNPKAMPLHFTLLFPEGTYGYDQDLKHNDCIKRVSPRAPHKGPKGPPPSPPKEQEGG